MTTLATVTTVMRISSEAKTALPNYFIKCKWPLNKNLPRGRELVDILGTLLKNVVPDSNDSLGGLSHAQLARQLLNYKKDVFGMQRAVNNMSSLELKAKFQSRMGMSTSEFIKQTLTRLGSPGDPAFGKDLNLRSHMSSLLRIVLLNLTILSLLVLLIAGLLVWQTCFQRRSLEFKVRKFNSIGNRKSCYLTLLLSLGRITQHLVWERI